MRPPYEPASVFMASADSTTERRRTFVDLGSFLLDEPFKLDLAAFVGWLQGFKVPEGDDPATLGVRIEGESYYESEGIKDITVTVFYAHVETDAEYAARMEAVAAQAALTAERQRVRAEWLEADERATYERLHAKYGKKENDDVEE